VSDFIKCGNTAHLCLIDVSKVFSKVSHHGLYLKLMKRRIIPVNLLVVLENWLVECTRFFLAVSSCCWIL